MKLTRRLSLAIAIALFPLALLALFAPVIRVPVMVAIAIAFLAGGSTVVLGTHFAPLIELKPARPVIVTVLVGLSLAALGLLISRMGGGRSIAEVASGLIGSASVLVVGCALGGAVGGRIVHTGHLMAVALASSAADIWSVHAPRGITRAIVETPDFALQRVFAISAAIPPDRVPMAAVGFGDVVFVALYFAAGRKHALSTARLIMAAVIGLIAAGACTFILRQPIPALPFLGAAVIALEPRTRVIARGDRWPTMLAGVLLIFAIVRIWL